MFPPSHPYFERAKGRITSEILETLSAESLYIDVVLPKSDTTIKVSAMQKEGEMVKNIETLRILSENGYKDMKLLPDLYSEEAKRRVYPEGQLPPNIKKNADSIIGGTVYEIKTFTPTIRNIQERMRKASEQARAVVLNMKGNRDNLSDSYIEMKIRNYMNLYNIDKAIVIYNDEQVVIKEIKRENR